MTSLDLAMRLRSIVESLTPGAGSSADDRDLLELKRMLLSEVRALKWDPEPEPDKHQTQEERGRTAKNSSHADYDS
jgi:hypothetical protein